MSDYRQRMDDLREQSEARNADRAMAPLERRIERLERALRKIADGYVDMDGIKKVRADSMAIAVNALKSK